MTTLNTNEVATKKVVTKKEYNPSPLQVAKKDARLNWLNDTRTLTAITKWILGDGKEYCQKVIDELTSHKNNDKAKIELTLNHCANIKNIVSVMTERELTFKDGTKKSLFQIGTILGTFGRMYKEKQDAYKADQKKQVDKITAKKAK